MEMKGTAKEVPQGSRGVGSTHPEIQQVLDALALVQNGDFAVFGFENKDVASKRAAALKNRKLEAFCRGVDVYVRRPQEPVNG